jgi:MFS family permease
MPSRARVVEAVEGTVLMVVTVAAAVVLNAPLSSWTFFLALVVGGVAYAVAVVVLERRAPWEPRQIPPGEARRSARWSFVIMLASFLAVFAGAGVIGMLGNARQADLRPTCVYFASFGCGMVLTTLFAPARPQPDKPDNERWLDAGAAPRIRWP